MIWQFIMEILFPALGATVIVLCLFWIVDAIASIVRAADALERIADVLECDEDVEEDEEEDNEEKGGAK